MAKGLFSRIPFGGRTGRNRNARPEAQHAVTAWTLAWRKFRRHNLALVSLAFLVVWLTILLFAEFTAPYFPAESSSRIFMSPQAIRFVDSTGKFHLRPFVYGMKPAVTADFETVFAPDTSQVFPIQFLVKRPKGQFGPTAQEMQTVLFGVDKPGYIHLLGTYYRGRDLLSRIIHGGRTSLTVGLFGVILSTILGTIIGTISGYYSGIVDMIIQRAIEIISSIPQLPLWLALAAILPKDWPSNWTFWGITTVLAFIGWTGLARAVRGMVLSVRERDFVMASTAGGGNARHIMSQHVVPNVLSHLIVVTTMAIPGIIMAESGLSFLGFGIKPPQASWGLLLKDAQDLHAILISPWIMTPGLCIILTVSAFNFLGDGLRDAADPYQ